MDKANSNDLAENLNISERDDKLLSGAQAAEFLGVKSATLYAYTSRGLIESFPSLNARERCYKLSDLVRLRQSARGFKSAKDNEAATWTGPIIKSAITEIANFGHSYRGKSAIELATNNSAFELVTELLWDTNKTNNADWRTKNLLEIPSKMKLALKHEEFDYLELLKLLLVLLEINDPVCRKLSSDDILDTARRLIVRMSTTPSLLTGSTVYKPESQFLIAENLLLSLASYSSSEDIKLVNQALVLCADHELNASTLACRIAASCDASLYSCLLSALGTFSGTLHGSASRRTEDMIRHSMQFKSAKIWLKDYLRHNDQIAGFGTELYKEGDPRAKLLIDKASQSSSENPLFERLTEIVNCVREELGREPNLDVGLSAVSFALSLPPGSGSLIFAVSRSAGWIAHAIEQRLYGGIIRPRARYIGR